MPQPTMRPERVVLLSESGEAIGSADKASVHTEDTPLHLAFSCHVLNQAGQVLVTRRSLDKLTWPGVWTNSFCGHPAPGEAIEDALRRRARDELGLILSDVELVSPDFRYRAVDASGIVENEICPVYLARSSGTPTPEPSEVAELRWMDAVEFIAAVRSAPEDWSPWLVWHLPEIAESLRAKQAVDTSARP